MRSVLQAPFAGQILIRLCSVVLVIILVATLPHRTALLLFFALALGHMAMAFLYQRDAKKWNRRKLLLAGIGFCGLAIVCNVYPTIGFIVANLTFVFHMLWDEAYLFNRPTSRIRTLEMLPFLVLWGSIFIYVAFGKAYFPEAYIVAAFLFLIQILAYRYLSQKPDIVTYVLGGWASLALVACLIVQNMGMLVPASLWFFGLVTTHFFIWYGDYFGRVAGNLARKNVYLQRVLVTNTVSLGLAGVFLFTGFAPLALFFSIGFANAWSLLHILSSIRFATLRSSFGL